MNFKQKVFTRLPRSFRSYLLRYWVQHKFIFNGDITIRLATTPSDYLGAFELLYKCYLESGSEAPNVAQLRVTPYHLLPSTAVILVEKNSSLIGTLSIVRESGFGMPINKIYNLDPIRSPKGRIAEISSLAIDPAHRGRNGEILFPLFNSMFHLCEKVFSIRQLVICIKLFRRDFYENLFNFKPMSFEPVHSYSFANGATVIGEHLSLDTLEPYVKGLTEHNRSFQPLLQALRTNPPITNFESKRPFGSINQPIHSLQTLETIFIRKKNVISQLDFKQKLYLCHLYKNSPEIIELIFKGPYNFKNKTMRQSPRFEVSVFGLTKFDTSPLPIPLEITEVALKSVKFMIQSADFKLPCPCFKIKIDFNPLNSIEISIQIIKRLPNATYVGRLLQTNSKWEEWINTLDSTTGPTTEPIINNVA